MAKLKTYLILLPVLFVIDYIWLGMLMGPFYVEELGALARMGGDGFAPVVWAAVIVYLIIPLGIVVFVLPLVPERNQIMSALGYGLLYGLVLYGVFDMTNYALLDGYSLKLAVVDVCWGGFLNSIAALCAVKIYRYVSV